MGETTSGEVCTTFVEHRLYPPLSVPGVPPSRGLPAVLTLPAEANDQNGA
jgi:hypothetical protein